MQHHKLNRIAGIAMLSALAVVSNAQAVENDYTTQIGAFKTSIQSFFTTNGGPLLVALAAVLLFGIVWKLMKRVAKSV